MWLVGFWSWHHWRLVYIKTPFLLYADPTEYERLFPLHAPGKYGS